MTHRSTVNDLLAATLSGRLSRRSAIRRATALGLSAPMFSMLLRTHGAAAQGTPAADLSGELEIFSWWTSGGEAAALDSLFQAYNALYPNVDIINSAVAGGGGTAAQPVLQTRLSGGNPPDSWQTHIGRELYDRYVTPGFCEPITDLFGSEGWTDVVPAGLVDQVTQDGEQYAVPVGVHRGNGFWYNKQVLEDAGVTVADAMTIDEFFTAADAVKANGIAALGYGDQEPFVSTQTFENTLLGVVGPEKYMGLWDGSVAWDDDQVKEAMTTFGRMLDYVNEDHSALVWSGAIDNLIQGKAAFNSMGDWAYGEFVAKDVVENIGWISHPGTQGSFVLVVDCFTLPVVAPNTDNARAWLQILGTREAQEAFNPLKGSIPARTDVDKAAFSEYHQWSMESFAADALVPSVAHGEAATPQFQQAMNDAAASFVVDRDTEVFASTLVDAWAQQE